MDFWKANQFTPPQPRQPFHQAFESLQNNFFKFLNNVQAKFPQNSPLFAKIAAENTSIGSKGNSPSSDVIEERLAGIPVYALSNGSKEFVLVSGGAGKNLGLFCLSESDAESLLKTMKKMDSSMGSESQVVAVALSKIFQLKVDGVALRLIPEASQIKNALTERKRVGVQEESFPGIPVFQSRSLILRIQKKRYRPVFFRKEDLEKSLSRASIDQKQFNPALRQGDVQVAVLEEIVRGMKDGSTSVWDDVVFIPPGFDVSANTSE